MDANSYTEMRLSRETGIAQPTINRALKNPARLTNTHRKLCKFASIEIEGSADSGDEETREGLVKAVLDVWDGTREHAQSIARLLKAGATLEAYGASKASKPRKSHASRQ